MRVVLDVNVLVSALLSPTGAPALLIEKWLFGEFELVVSSRLLEEVNRALAYPKVNRRLQSDARVQLVALLEEFGEYAADPPRHSVRSPDPGDDYLVALAASERATLVSGDSHLLALRGSIPVLSPREFLDSLA